MSQEVVNQLIRDVYRRWREALGKEQSVLADAIGVSVSKLSKWEWDQGSMTDEQIERLGEELRKLSEKQDEPLELPQAPHTLGTTFSRQLFRQLRESNGLSQTALAERAGLLQFTISMFETGQAQMKRHEEERAINALKAVIREREQEIKQYQQI